MSETVVVQCKSPIILKYEDKQKIIKSSNFLLILLYLCLVRKVSLIACEVTFGQHIFFQVSIYSPFIIVFPSHQTLNLKISCSIDQSVSFKMVKLRFFFCAVLYMVVVGVIVIINLL